jgi:hypothetical protein
MEILIGITSYGIYTSRSFSYLDIHVLMEIDSEGWLRTNLYDKRDDFKFPIVNVPSINTNPNNTSKKTGANIFVVICDTDISQRLTKSWLQP